MENKLLFQCRRAGCSERFTCVGSRGHHEREHDWAPRQCSRGCTDGKWFHQTKESWNCAERTMNTWMPLRPVPLLDVVGRQPSPSRSRTEST